MFHSGTRDQALRTSAWEARHIALWKPFERDIFFFTKTVHHFSRNDFRVSVQARKWSQIGPQMILGLYLSDLRTGNDRLAMKHGNLRTQELEHWTVNFNTKVLIGNPSKCILLDWEFHNLKNLYQMPRITMYLQCTSEDVYCGIRNVKLIRSKFLQHALCCHVYHRSLGFIST